MSTVSTPAPDSDNLYKTNDFNVTPPQNSVDNSQTIGIAIIPMANEIELVSRSTPTCTYQDLCARMSGNQPDSQSVSVVSNDRLDSIESLLLSLAPTITAIQLDVSTIKSDSEKVKVMESDLAIMKTQNGELFEQNKELHKIIELESYSRRNNIVLRNVPEDNVPTNVTIRNILVGMNICNVNSILIDDAHRIGPHRSNNTGSYQPKPRLIIFRLVMRHDRRRIWEARRNLKGSGFILSEDLAEDHEKDRNRLRPVMNVALAKGARATFVGNKAKIDGKIYGVDDIDNLPSDLDPMHSCTVEDDNMLAFFGRHSPLSNFNKCDIVVEGRHFRRRLPGQLKLKFQRKSGPR